MGWLLFVLISGITRAITVDGSFIVVKYFKWRKCVVPWAGIPWQILTRFFEDHPRACQHGCHGQVTMEITRPKKTNSHVKNWTDPSLLKGKIHYFDWAMFNSYICMFTRGFDAFLSSTPQESLMVFFNPYGLMTTPRRWAIQLLIHTVHQLGLFHNWVILASPAVSRPELYQL